MKLSEVGAAAPQEAPKLKLSQAWANLVKPEEKEQPRTDKLSALWAGLVRGGQEVLEGVEQLGTAMPSMTGLGRAGLERSREALKTGMTQSARDYQTNPAAVAHPLISGAGRIGGNVAATAPLMMTPGGAAGAAGRTGAGLLGRAGAAGATGAAMMPVSTENYWTEKGKQAGVGFLAGMALPAVGGMISPRLPNPGVVAQGVSRAFRPFYNFFTGAEERTNEGFARTIARQTLDPIGAQGRITGRMSGHELVDTVESSLSDAYKQIHPHISLQKAGVPPPGPDLANYVTTMSDDHIRRFNATMNGYFDKKFSNGVMDGETFQRARSELTKRASAWAGTNDDELGRAVMMRLREISASLEQQNPQFAPQLSRINEGWMMYARMRTAASGATSAGKFSPSDYLKAVRRKDQSVDHGAHALGENVMQGFAEAADAAMGRRSMSLYDLMHVFTHRGLPMQAVETIAGPVARGAKATAPFTAPVLGEGAGREVGRERHISPMGP